jgi:hypothetical protein
LKLQTEFAPIVNRHPFLFAVKIVALLLQLEQCVPAVGTKLMVMNQPKFALFAEIV